MIFSKYQIAEAVVILEYTLVVLVILSTFILHFIFSTKSKQKQKQEKNLEQYLKKKINSNESIVLAHFPKKWQKIDTLLHVVYRLDKDKKNTAWENLRSSLLHTFLVPMARGAFKAKYWLSRFYAAEVFGLYSDKDDEQRIFNLLNDPIPLVRLTAFNAAIRQGSMKLMMTVVQHISKERSLAQSIYLKIFDEVPTSVFSHVTKCLSQENPKDQYLKATYYKILLKAHDLSLKLDLKSELGSENIELRLAAIRLFARGGQSSVPGLKALLKDEQWQVRAVALHCLKDMHAIESIEDIAECLKDPNWWVRLVAAQTLSDFGEKGLAILQAQDFKKDQFAFDVSKHTLEMLGVDA